MATNRRGVVNPQDVRSHAHGEHFRMVLIAPWVLGVLVGAVVSLAFGVGMAVAIGSGLAIALGLNFVWVVIVFAIDDGDVNDRAQGTESHENVTPRAR